MAYAAAVASALRIRACIVTGEAAAHRCCGTSLRLCRHVLCWLRGMWLSAAGGQDANLSAFEGHDVHLVPTSETLTFEHSYTWWGHRRKLKVRLSTGVHYGSFAAARLHSASWHGCCDAEVSDRAAIR